MIAALEGGGGNAEANWTEVWPENWKAVQGFGAIATQWRIAPLMSGRLHYEGLDYSGARAGLELAGLQLTASDWAGVRILEREVKLLLNGYQG